MFNYKETMDRLIRQEVEEGRVKGASALVVHKGKEIYYNAFGLADAERGIPMKRDTIIRLYSMTKPVTAAATMILVERGELDLWDPVSMYLPAFKNQVVWSEGREIPANRENTIFDLLNMTSGIIYPDENCEPGRRMKAVVDDFVSRRKQGEWIDTRAYADAIAAVPLVFHPGEKWMYGFSADILGAVIEVVTGMKFSDFLQKELFDPLEMVDTGFFVPKEKADRWAQYYDWMSDGSFVPHDDNHLGEYCGEDVAFESGGAGLVSTLDDYLHFATMMVQKGQYKGKRILGTKTVEFMTKNHLSAEQLKDFNWFSTVGHGYSCLMRVLIDKGAAATNESLGEYGWDGWTGNYVTMNPNEELVFLYFIQRCGAGMTPVVRKLRTATYAVLDEQ